jgi:hypothetical protein
MFPVVDRKRTQYTVEKSGIGEKSTTAQRLRRKIDFRLTAADYLANVRAP